MKAIIWIMMGIILMAVQTLCLLSLIPDAMFGKLITGTTICGSVSALILTIYAEVDDK